MNFFKTKYRITRDVWDAWEAQYKLWYWPFWKICFGYNTNKTVEAAKVVCDRHRFPIPYEPEKKGEE